VKLLVGLQALLVLDFPARVQEETIVIPRISAIGLEIEGLLILRMIRRASSKGEYQDGEQNQKEALQVTAPHIASSVYFRRVLAS
jgi:hypothetical protein